LLFVSHDTNAVINLCKKAIFLDKGKIVFNGNAEKAVHKYSQFAMEMIHSNKLNSFNDNNLGISDNQNHSLIDSSTEITFFSQLEDSSGYKTGQAKILAINLLNSSGKEINSLLGGENVIFEIIAEVYKDLESPILGWYLKDRLGQSLFGENTYKYTTESKVARVGQKIKATFKFRMPLLPNGEYTATVSIADGDPVNHIQHHWIHDALVFQVRSKELRYGLVGIQFESVSLNIIM
jgi:lipopolysaccharide transport system ATP-binding protein